MRSGGKSKKGGKARAKAPRTSGLRTSASNTSTSRPSSGNMGGERAWFLADGNRRGPGLLERGMRGMAGAYPLLASAAVVATIAYNMRAPEPAPALAEVTPAIIDSGMRQRAMPVADFQYGLSPQPDTFVVPAFSAPVTSNSVIGTSNANDVSTLISSAPVPNAKPEFIPVVMNSVAAPPKARIAVVIDDMGLRQSMTRRFAALDAPMTFAFLPYASGLKWQTKAMADAGHELMLHLPMEPYGQRNGGQSDGGQEAGVTTADNPGPKALLSGLDSLELQERLVWNLSRFEGFKGINNHMGSRLTEDAGVMQLVMGALKGQDLYFLDSRTSPDSVAAKAAQTAGLNWQERDVFIDNDRNIAAVLQQLVEAERIALAGGSAIAIGHPYDVTLKALGQWIPTLHDKGIELVFASNLMHTPTDTTRVANSPTSSTITAGGGGE